MPARHAVLLTSSKSSGPGPLLSCKQILPVTSFRINTSKTVSKQGTLSPFRINTGSVDIPDTVLISRVDKKRLTVFSDGAGGTMAEVGLLPFARVALEVATQVLPPYRTRFSKHQLTQPQLLAVPCPIRYPDWTFRE